MDLRNLQSDREFMALPFEEKKKAVAMLDPSFAALHPDEQDRGLSMIFPRSVSETARQRLGAEGLTPEDVKAGKGVSTPDQFASPGMSLLDIGGAIGKGLAHFVGAPTSMEGLKQAGKDAALMAVFPPAAMAKQTIEMPGAVAGAVQSVAAPSRAVADNRAPSDTENLGAIESGTTLAAMAGAPAIAKAVAPSAADALAASARTQYGKALGGGPVAEEVGAQLADRGVVMRNPKAQLPDVLGQNDVTLPNGMRVKGLPNAQEPAKAVDLVESGKRIAGSAAAGAGLGAAGGTHAAGIGARIGAVAGTAGEIAGVVKTIMTNPLWRTASAVTKSAMAGALKSGDFGTVADIAGRFMGAQALDDKFGHDTAVRDAVNDSFTQAQGNPQVARQILGGKGAVYENADGTEIPIPYAVFRAFVNQLGWDTANGYQPLAQSDGQGGQDSAGGPGGNPVAEPSAAQLSAMAEDERRANPMPGGRGAVLAQRTNTAATGFRY